MPRGRRKRYSPDYTHMTTTIQDHRVLCLCTLDGLCQCSAPPSTDSQISDSAADGEALMHRAVNLMRVQGNLSTRQGG